MKHFFISALLLLIPILSFSQANFKKGLVVTSHGDTLRGYINYKEWIKNPVSISFKTTIETNYEQEFTPKTSKYFEVQNQETYLSYQGRVSADRIELAKITTLIDTSKIFTQSFLKVLQKGENISLLMLSDDIKVRFFIKDTKVNTIQELTFRRFYDIKNGNKLVNSKGFMGQLWVVATKYNVATPSFRKQLELAEYNSADLIKIVSVLNNFKENKIKSEHKSSTRYFAGLGVNYSITNIKGRSTLNNGEVKNTGSVLPKIVIGMDKLANPNVGRLIFRAEASFTKTYQKLSNQFNTTLYKEEFKQNIVSLSPQIIYNVFNKDHLKLFLGGGISVNLAQYPKTEDHYYDLDKFYFSIPLRTGFTIHNFEISALYFPAVPISKYKDIEFQIQSAHFQVNYLFNK